MTIVLHRFPLSHYSEKARAALDFKGLEYRIVEHRPGLEQLAIYRLSGQRRLPVIEHDGKVVADSTEIALYLERTFPDGRRLLPEEPSKRLEILALEAQLDDTLGKFGPRVWLRHALRDEQYLDAMGAATSPLFSAGLRAMAAVLPLAEQQVGAIERRFDEAERTLRATLDDLCVRLEASKYLVGDEPSLADVAAVGLVHFFKFPPSKHLFRQEVAGAAVRSIAEHPDLAAFFDFRDRFYRDYLQ
ncbi:glutathione S-transferase family protein [Sorangium sp. So ce1182]|uniref:glutathione S-transferase family protein n=1 Tax=Sorangium sp. So ce1182 TaxID=3133334 RepID=UPI003F5F45FA